MTFKQHIPALVTGLIFLVSGFAKACDATYFSAVIAGYGFPELHNLSPAIILAEVLLGLALVCRIRPRLCSAAGIAMTIGFTVAYVYAMITQGITDCGCFGHLNMLSDEPVVVIAKNVVIIALLAFTFIKDKGSEWLVPKGRLYALRVAVPVIILIATAAATFITGFTFQENRSYGKPVDMPVSQSALNEMLDLSPDSTYYVFAFSYTCPHCMNSIANLKEYAASGVVDRVIGLALGDAPIAHVFDSIFQPNFTIHTYGVELFELTNRFPRGYYISHDTIRMEMKGELPCEFIFRDIVSSIEE